jgi:hypothetical protein
MPNYGNYPGYTWPMGSYQQQQQTNQQQQTAPADKKKEYQEYVDWYNENPPAEGYSRAAQQPYDEWYQENYPTQQATTTQTQQQRMTPFIPQNISNVRVKSDYGKIFNRKTPKSIEYSFDISPNMQGSQNNPSTNMTASTSMYMPNLSKVNIPGTNQNTYPLPLMDNPDEYPTITPQVRSQQSTTPSSYTTTASNIPTNRDENRKANNAAQTPYQEYSPSYYESGRAEEKREGIRELYGQDRIRRSQEQRVKRAIDNQPVPEFDEYFRKYGGLKKAQEGMQQPSEEEMMMMQQAQQQQPQQEGGQDMMQQIGQALQQGVQPEQIIVQLIQQQVSPEEIMQIFVELGMPQEQVEGLILAITEKMQGSQQQMDPRQMQQAAMMMHGGYHPNRRLRRAQNGNFGNDAANAPMYNPTSMEDEIGFAPSKRVDWINTPDNRTVKSPENTVTAKLNKVSPWKDTFSGQRGAESILSGVKAITGAANIADYGRQSEVAADKMLPDAWSPTQTNQYSGDIVRNTGAFRPDQKIGERYQDNPFGQFYRRDGGQYATGKEYYMDGGEIDRLKELGYIVEYLD